MSAQRAIATGMAAFAAVLAAACANLADHSAAAKPSPCPSGPTFASGADRATLWMRNTSEYRALTETIYRAALVSLKEGLADPSWTAEPSQAVDFSTLPPAVVMDVDESVLDNSESEVRLLLQGTCFNAFPASWDAWVAERKAPAVPGSVEFIQSARMLKDPAGRAVRVYFVTNRECGKRPASDATCPQEEDTAANLRSLGLGTDALRDELLVRGERPDWGGEKLSRRQEIARSYRIVLNIGDDLADFLPEARRQTVADRDLARCSRDAFWGRRWFMLPNPVYGSWLVATGPDLTKSLAAEPDVLQTCPRP
ncbi:MAG TPA: HAD family acid phosphatase [Steroidobacteraceae bacterium]|jgi:acid phosphatase